MGSLPLKVYSLLVCVVSLAGVVGGCASVPSQTAGRATGLHLRIHWPARTVSRVIPQAAQSIKVKVDAYDPDYTVAIAEKLIPRPAGSTPTSDINLAAMPVMAKVRITMTAYPNADGTGTPLAVATQEATTGKEGSSIDQEVTLDSTVDHLSVSPTGVSTYVGLGATVTAAAYNAKNEVVLTAPESWTWVSSAPSSVTVGATGNPVSVSGKAAGSATITGTQTDSGKTVTFTVTVTTTGGPPGCRFPGQLYGDGCGRDQNGTYLYWNCDTGACEEILVK